MCCYMPEKKYKMPALCWLRVTDYIKGWLRYELGGVNRVNGQYVVSLQHLEGARAILRMETVNDTMEPSMSGNAMSATRYNCVAAGTVLPRKRCLCLFPLNVPASRLHPTACYGRGMPTPVLKRSRRLPCIGCCVMRSGRR